MELFSILPTKMNKLFLPILALKNSENRAANKSKNIFNEIISRHCVTKISLKKLITPHIILKNLKCLAHYFLANSSLDRAAPTAEKLVELAMKTSLRISSS